MKLIPGGISNLRALAMEIIENLSHYNIFLPLKTLCIVNSQ